MIVLFTDFGLTGPYTGQMKSVLYQKAPDHPVVDLFADAPVHNSRASAYLLAAYDDGFPEGTVFLCVVDPGVGSRLRKPVVLNADGKWYVGPDNGLFNIVRQRAIETKQWEIVWQPELLSATFHGRDLFAPVAAHIAAGDVEEKWLKPSVPESAYWDEDLFEVIYIDHFGNAITGIRGSAIREGGLLQVNGRLLQRARVFSDVAPGDAFYYTNSNGLIEIAVNRGRADEQLQLKPGDAIRIES